MQANAQQGMVGAESRVVALTVLGRDPARAWVRRRQCQCQCQTSPSTASAMGDTKASRSGKL
jgi:hypothetical protein